MTDEEFEKQFSSRFKGISLDSDLLSQILELANGELKYKIVYVSEKERKHFIYYKKDENKDPLFGRIKSLYLDG